MRWYDVNFAIEQFAASNITQAALEKTLARVKLTSVTDTYGKRLLANFAWDGSVKAVDWLLGKGVDPNQVDTSLAVHGSALMYAATSNRAKPADRIAIIERLVAAGADVDLPLARSRSHPWKKGEFKGGTALDYACFEALRALKLSNSKSYDGDSRRFAKSMHAGYLKVIPALVKAGAAVSKETDARLRELGLAAGAPATKTAASRLEKGWAAKAMARLAKPRGLARDVICELIEAWGTHPEAVASADWAKVVGAMIGCSRSFESVAKEVYGEMVSFEDDEGHLCQGWENYVVLDLVLELLGNEATARNAKWESLVRRVFDERKKAHAVDYVDVDELFFDQPWVQKLAAVKALRAAEKKSR